MNIVSLDFISFLFQMVTSYATASFMSFTFPTKASISDANIFNNLSLLKNSRSLHQQSQQSLTKNGARVSADPKLHPFSCRSNNSSVPTRILPEQQRFRFLQRLCDDKRLAEAFQITKVMEADKAPIQTQSLIVLLQACIGTGSLEFLREVHNYIKRSHLKDNTTLINQLAAAYCKMGSTGEARQVFEVIPEQSYISEIKKNNSMLNKRDSRNHGVSETKRKAYEKVRELHEKMKLEGYVPDTRFVLHDIDEEAKEKALMYHSERLTIAYGLINTAPGTTLRIMKNLRICGDCHNAIKITSKIVKREIIVKDNKRFHHFKDGICSCRDYW